MATPVQSASAHRRRAKHLREKARRLKQAGLKRELLAEAKACERIASTLENEVGRRALKTSARNDGTTKKVARKPARKLVRGKTIARKSTKPSRITNAR